MNLVSSVRYRLSIFALLSFIKICSFCQKKVPRGNSRTRMWEKQNIRVFSKPSNSCMGLIKKFPDNNRELWAWCGRLTTSVSTEALGPTPGPPSQYRDRRRRGSSWYRSLRPARTTTALYNERVIVRRRSVGPIVGCHVVYSVYFTGYICLLCSFDDEMSFPSCLPHPYTIATSRRPWPPNTKHSSSRCYPYQNHTCLSSHSYDLTTLSRYMYK